MKRCLTFLLVLLTLSVPVVLQAAQHVIHPPVVLESWRDADRSSRIVFIVRNMARESVESLFGALGALGKRGSE